MISIRRGTQVGLTDLSSVTQLAESQRRALCRLYHTLADLRREDAANPSEAAELKARAAMESVGLVIDLPVGGSGMDEQQQRRRGGSLSGRGAEEEASLALASAAERVIAASYGGAIVGDGDDSEDSSEEEEGEGDGGEGHWEAGAEAVEGKEEEGGRAAAGLPPPVAASSAPLTYVMLLRGLFDTRRDEALALVGGRGMELLKGMAVRRLPQAMVPVLKMVANLRGLCAHLVSGTAVVLDRKHPPSSHPPLPLAVVVLLCSVAARVSPAFVYGVRPHRTTDSSSGNEHAFCCARCLRCGEHDGRVDGRGGMQPELPTRNHLSACV